MSLSPLATALQGIGFSPRLVAVQGLWPDSETVIDENDDGFGMHTRRSWRPMPIADVHPRKRPHKRRRREEMLLLKP